MPIWLAMLIGIGIGMAVCAIVSGMFDDVLDRVKIVKCRNCIYKNQSYGCKINDSLKSKDNGFCSNAIDKNRRN